MRGEVGRHLCDVRTSLQCRDARMEKTNNTPLRVDVAEQAQFPFVFLLSLLTVRAFSAISSALRNYRAQSGLTRDGSHWHTPSSPAWQRRRRGRTVYSILLAVRSGETSIHHAAWWDYVITLLRSAVRSGSLAASPDPKIGRRVERDGQSGRVGGRGSFVS